MKQSKLISAIAVATLLTSSIFATPVTQYLKIMVTETSNLTVQQPTTLLFAFNQDGSNGVDQYDMGNINSIPMNDDNAFPFSLSSCLNAITQTDARPELTAYSRIPFGFISKFPATIKIVGLIYGNTSDETNRPAYAWIEQISTGYRYSLMTDTVKLDIPANLDFTSDFYIHVGPAIRNQVTDETCFNTLDGEILILNPNATNWTISVLHNSIPYSSTTVNQPIGTVSGLASGYYTVMTIMNSVPVDSIVLFVGGPQQIIPDFTIDNYIPTTDDVVTLTNYTANASTYSWDFGDGNFCNLDNTSHQYTSAGNYRIVLTATNEMGCQETVYDSVFVTAGIPPMHQGPNFIENFETNNSTFDESADNEFIFDPSVQADNSAMRIVIRQNEEQSITISVIDMNGQLISTAVSTDASFEVNVPQNGIYIVQMSNSKGEFKSKTIVVTN